MIDTFTVDGLIYELHTDIQRGVIDGIVEGVNPAYQPETYGPLAPECQFHGIEHRQIIPGLPQTNAMVDRFNGRVSDMLVKRRYASGEAWIRRSNVTLDCNHSIS
ncbi:hypothetical protein [Halomonas sp. NCCP-2165]|nr:hypothetical protein NCCP2165_08160 [Halomonas sp. NCCP-2165]